MDMNPNTNFLIVNENEYNQKISIEKELDKVEQKN